MTQDSVIQEKLVLKPLLEYASQVEDGVTIYAHTHKQGTMSIRKHEDTYIYEFDYLRTDITFTGKEATLADFLSRIDYDENEEYDVEMKELTTQPVWSIHDEYVWDMKLAEAGVVECLEYGKLGFSQQ